LGWQTENALRVTFCAVASTSPFEYSPTESHKEELRRRVMRAEIENIVDEIQQALSLLRRHL
jgi:hypothetical protein